MNRADLEALIERVEKATGPDREIDAALYRAVHNEGGWVGGNWYVEDGGSSHVIALPPYTASLDAIVRLIERELPDWNVHLFSDCGSYFARVEHFDAGEWHYVTGFGGDGVERNEWCLSLISAFLRARLAEATR